MAKREYYPAIIVSFKKKNGEQWTETYSSRLLDIFEKDSEVYEIRYADTDKLIYKRDN